MPKGVYERKPKEDEMSNTGAASQMFPVMLNKNYVPKGEFEIIGYWKPEVKKKAAGGGWVIETPEEFIKGEMKPHPNPGVGFPNKIWAGTHIRLPVDEAKHLVAKKIADRADAIAA